MTRRFTVHPANFDNDLWFVRDETTLRPVDMFGQMVVPATNKTIRRWFDAPPDWLFRLRADADALADELEKKH